MLKHVCFNSNVVKLAIAIARESYTTYLVIPSIDDRLYIFIQVKRAVPVKNRKPHFTPSIILRLRYIHHEVEVNDITKTKVKQNKRNDYGSLDTITNTNYEYE